VPTHIDGVRSVVVNEALRELEPLAYHFVVNFAKDNDLQVVEACVLPDPPKDNKAEPDCRRALPIPRASFMPPLQAVPPAVTLVRHLVGSR
jgi:hypothetical protein